MSSSSNVHLAKARYGKDKVRVLRVVRTDKDKYHHVVEYNVAVLVEGDIDSSYTHADNSVVVATDSLKNITYYLSKVSPHILSPERFALHLGTHIISKYPHLHKAYIDVEQLRWSRIAVGPNQEPHGHSFLRDGDEKRLVKVEVDGTNLSKTGKLIGTMTAGVSDLLVLKSTNSSFSSFVRDEYTTLAEVDDRIFSTSVDLTYSFSPIEIPVPRDEKLLEFKVPAQGAGTGSVWDLKVAERSRVATLEVFADDNSASVQATLYKMAQRIIGENQGVDSVTYSLPNKHYVPVDMRYINVDNITPAKAEVFTPLAAPSGLITATVKRQQAHKSHL